MARDPGDGKGENLLPFFLPSPSPFKKLLCVRTVGNCADLVEEVVGGDSCWVNLLTGGAALLKKFIVNYFEHTRSYKESHPGIYLLD